MTKVLIDTDVVDQGARRAAAAQHEVGQAWRNLGGTLSGAAGMAGNPGKDAAAAKFIGAYDAAAQAAWQGFSALHRLTGGMSKGLVQTANNHSKADRRSAPGSGFSMFQKPQPQSFVDMLLNSKAEDPINVPAPPPASGPGKPEPKAPLTALTGIELIDISEYWSTGDSSRLATAAKGWQAAHDTLTSVRAGLANDVERVVDHSDAPDIEAFGRYWTRLYAAGKPTTLFDGLPQLCANLAKACSEYAAAVLEAQMKIGGAAGNPVAAVAQAAALRAALAAAAGRLLQAVGAITVGALADHIVTAVATGAASAPHVRILEAEAEDGDFEEILDEWDYGSGEPDPENLEKNTRKIAKELGYTPQEIEKAIHSVKGASDWRGIGSNKNPDMVVDTRTGEVYPQTKDGVGESSLGNILDHLPERD